jgi:hypothetical protein
VPTLPERRYPGSRITAYYQAPEQPGRSRRRLTKPKKEKTTTWVVVVTTGNLADHHHFDDELDALNFALAIDPDFKPPEPSS